MRERITLILAMGACPAPGVVIGWLDCRVLARSVASTCSVRRKPNSLGRRTWAAYLGDVFLT